MEFQKQNTITNVGKNQASLSSNTLYAQNPPSISLESLAKLVPSVTGKRTDRPKTGQLGSKNQKKRAVSKIPEKTESYKKMRNAVDKNSNNFIPWSPQAVTRMTQDYLARQNKSSASIVKSPTAPNSNGCSRQNESEMQWTLGHPKVQVKQVALSPKNNYDSHIRKIESEKQQTLKKPNAQFKNVPLTIPQENVEVNNFDSSRRRSELEKQ